MHLWFADLSIISSSRKWYFTFHKHIKTALVTNKIEIGRDWCEARQKALRASRCKLFGDHSCNHWGESNIKERTEDLDCGAVGWRWTRKSVVATRMVVLLHHHQHHMFTQSDGGSYSKLVIGHICDGRFWYGQVERMYTDQSTITRTGPTNWTAAMSSPNLSDKDNWRGTN